MKMKSPHRSRIGIRDTSTGIPLKSGIFCIFPKHPVDFSATTMKTTGSGFCRGSGKTGSAVIIRGNCD